MSITIRDCLKLPSLSLGRVIAGHKGLDSIVTTVSVLEFDDGTEEDIMTPNELLISAFYCLKDDVTAQCKFLHKSKHNGDVGLVLFYTDVILSNIDQRLLQTADLLNFPIILLPENDMGLKYSDVIVDVMEAIFYDRKVNHYFVSSAIERLSQTPESVRSPALALQLASSYAKASFFLCDGEYNLIASSFWPANNYLNFKEIKNIFAKNSFSGHQITEDGKKSAYFSTPFSGKSGSKLILCAVSQNDKLNNEIMTEVVEVIQLFTALWNYNLNVSVKEAVIPALFDNNEELAQYICSSTGINQEQYNQSVIIEMSSSADEDSVNSLLKKLQRIFKNHPVPLIADRLGTYIVMLYHNKGQTKGKIIEEEIDGLLIENNHVVTFTRYHSEQLFHQMAKEFIEYSTVKEDAMKIYPCRKRFTEEDIHYVRKVHRIFQSIDGEKDYYLNLLAPITDDSDSELIRTLACYLLDASSGLKKTSELLFVHRNTVLYRLNKIKELLGYDLSKMPMAYDIYMAISIYRLSE